MPSLEDVARTDLLRVELPYHVKDRGEAVVPIKTRATSKAEGKMKRVSKPLEVETETAA